MGKTSLRKAVGAIIVLAALALMVLSIVERNGGQLWMPWMHLVSWVVVMIGVAAFTYEPEEASRARLQQGDPDSEKMDSKRAA